MTKHHLTPSRTTLHGSFSRDYPPVLTITPGDSVIFTTLDVAWGYEPPTAPGIRKKFEPRENPRDSGHAILGPIAITGAEPGMTLAVRINEVIPSTWGWTSAGGWSSEINKRMNIADGPRLELIWSLDTQTMTGTSNLGHKVTLRPFMGLIGMPPNEPGIHPTAPPRYCGGNIDCKELIPGSTLYLPISVPGALVSVGDGHAAQGDGEVAAPAIECPMEKVDLTFDLLKDIHLTMPRAKTPTAWITFGFHEDLNEATYQALSGMLDLMQELFHIERNTALALASAVVDLRITQIVNGVRGVHAMLPHGSIK